MAFLDHQRRRTCSSWASKNSRGFPAIGTKEEVDYMIVHVDVTLEIAVDHLADRGRTVFTMSVFRFGGGRFRPGLELRTHPGIASL